MSIEEYAIDFPQLLDLPHPQDSVELIESIGKGNYGFVYKGKLLNRQIELAAIKVVFLKENEVRETLMEMELLCACDHPNIIQYYETFRKGLDLWICMEYCEAGAIDSIYKSFRYDIPEDTVACIIHEVLQALDYLHTTVGIIHRDIKSGNILLTRDGKVKLTDFGVSTMLPDLGARARTFVGTPYWMAPEVIICDPDMGDYTHNYDSKADIWSVGITAIEIAEKNPPLSEFHPMQVLSMIPTAELGFAKPEAFSRAFIDFVNSTLVRSPEKRPSAAKCLTHPFIKNTGTMNRQEILLTLASKACVVREKARRGLPFSEKDELYVPKRSNTDSANSSTDPFNQKAKSLLEGLLKQSFGPKASFPKSSVDSVSIPPFDTFPKMESLVQNGVDPVYRPSILTSFPDVLTAALLDDQYLLIGAESGLYFLNIANQHSKVPTPLLFDIRFKQIHILPELCVMIALSGKHDHIRQYNLAAIRKLILFVEGNDALTLNKTDLTVPIQQAELGQLETNEYEEIIIDSYVPVEEMVVSWADDFIKIVNTKDTREFSVIQTEVSTYLCTLRHGIILFKWATKPYSKFMKIKAFWVPEQPKFVSFATDGISVSEIYVGYAGELNRIVVADSNVKELKVHREMKSKGQNRWRGFHQIPFTDAKLEEILKENTRRSFTRKLAFAGPTLASANQPVHSFFLGTFGRLTKVVDKNGNPMTGTGAAGWNDGVLWTEPPVIQILKPWEQVISIGLNTIDIVEWKSAQILQRLNVDEPCKLRVLSSVNGSTLVAIDKEKVGSLIYWMVENPSNTRKIGDIMNRVLIQTDTLKEQPAPVYIVQNRLVNIPPPTAEIRSDTFNAKKLFEEFEEKAVIAEPELYLEFSNEE